MVSCYATPIAFDEFSELLLVQSLFKFQRVIKKLEEVSSATVRIFSYGPGVVSEVLTYIVGEVKSDVPMSNESQRLKR